MGVITPVEVSLTQPNPIIVDILSDGSLMAGSGSGSGSTINVFQQFGVYNSLLHAYITTDNYRLTVDEYFSWQQPIISILNTPPDLPTVGDRYIVGTAPTDIWTGHEKAIAWFDGLNWNYDVPSTGWVAFNLATLSLYYYTGTWGALDTTVKADKVAGAVAGNFAGLDVTGNLTDSGFDSASFDLSGTTTTHASLTTTHGVSGHLVGTTDIQTLTNKTLTSPKINENVALVATSTLLDDAVAKRHSQNTDTGTTASTFVINSTSGTKRLTIDTSTLTHNMVFDPTAYITTTSISTLTNKTILAPWGLVSSDVGLGSVDNVQQMPLSYLDADSALTANSDVKVASQKATKAYVDAAITGLSWKQSVRLATASLNVTLTGTQTVDGKSTVPGDRILVKDQSNPAANGIYEASAAGWTRSADANTANELLQMAVFVREGDSLADTAWVLTNNSITLESTALTYAQFAGSSTYVGGYGILVNGNQIRINTNVTTLTDIQTLTNKTLTNPKINDVVALSASSTAIDDAVTKKHTQNTDTGTSSTSWIVNSASGTKRFTIDTSGLSTATVIDASKFVTTDNSVTLTNKTLITPLGLVKGDVGLGSVDNVQQMPLSYLDIDGTLTANSDIKVASQKAIKTYVDAQVVGTGHLQNTDTGTDKTSWIINSTSGTKKLTLTTAGLSASLSIDGNDIVTRSAEQTLTNKTLITPLGLVSSDVGLGNVTNVAQMPLSYLDIDGTLTANSDTRVASQKAVKTYIDAHGSGGGHVQNTDTGTTQVTWIINSTSLTKKLTLDTTNLSVNTTVDAVKLVTTDSAQTLTNKTITAPLGLVSGDVGLGNVTNVAQMPLSYLDTDVALTANSNLKVPSQHAVKTYVDSVLQGVAWKQSVKLVTANNEQMNFVGPTFVDGRQASSGDRILVKDQQDPAQNGIWVVSNTGWTRATDADTPAKLLQMAVFAREGITNADTGWMLNADAITIGVTPLLYGQIGSGAAYTAGTGISISGVHVISINSTVATLTGVQTLTNKTLTSPKINEDVILTATSTQLNAAVAIATSYNLALGCVVMNL